MAGDRVIPDDPLGFIQRCLRERSIRWTYHVNMRLKGRAVTRRKILEAIGSYEIIESYPEDKYLPSYLVYCTAGQDTLHVLFATDVEDDNVRVVTAYQPDPREWEADLKTRRNAP